MQWHLNIYVRCFGPNVYSALYQFRTVKLELVKWTCVLISCIWKVFFFVRCWRDRYLWVGTESAPGVRPQCLCACWPNVSSRFNTPFLFSPVVPYSWRSKLSLSYPPEISPRTLNVSRCPSTSEIWCRNWKSCDRSCPSSSRRRDTAVSRSHVRRSLRWDPGLLCINIYLCMKQGFFNQNKHHINQTTVAGKFSFKTEAVII